VNRGESGNISANEAKIIEAALRGDGQVFIDEGIITGKREANMPWLRDEDDEDYE
jgi:hypothetical protein